MKLSLILPVYNPADGWAANVIERSNELRALYPNVECEVIVVNDGSVNWFYADGREKLVRTAINLMEYKTNKGKGEALRKGVGAASGNIIIYTDIDFPYTMGSMSDVLNLLINDEADVVIGVKDRSYYDHVPKVRRLISRFLRLLIRLFFRIPTDDTQCGLKGFNRKAKPIFLQTTIKRYLFDLEFVFLASQQKNIRIKMLEVSLREDIQFRKMNFGIIRSELWNFLKIYFKKL